MTETIVAPATPWGHSSVGIIRLSGDETIPILEKIFRSKNGISVSSIKTHTITYGHIFEKDKIIDEVLLFLMRKPRSFTREDVAEISSHGGPVIMKKILTLCVDAGARLAQPGEFTKRAFLNGRIDLVQSEAVSNIIKAKSEQAAEISQKHLSGEFSGRINLIREKILSAASEVSAALDFPEDETGASLKAVYQRICEVKNQVSLLLKTETLGKFYTEGVKIIIAGKPNVGKSSLINVLTSSERALVTPIPGTTRDILRESATLEGIPVEYNDTAGIRKNPRGIIEKMGIKKTMEEIEKANLVLYLCDASKKLDETDKFILKHLEKSRTIIVANKIDLAKLPLPFKNVSFISCKTKEGIEALKKKMVKSIMSGSSYSSEEVILTTERQAQALKKVSYALEEAAKKIMKKPAEASFELEEALSILDGLMGKVFREEMINEIFSRFCIGK